MTRFAPTALFLAAFAATTPALAQMPAEAPTKIVSYADLDLANPADQARLERRVAGAARVVCVIDDRIENALCRAKARAQAHDQMQRAIARASSAERLASVGSAPVVGN